MGGLGIFGGVGVLAAILAAVFALLWWALGLAVALSAFFVLVAAFMILVVLAQKPRGGGLSGAFGGAGGPSQTAFGAKTGDVLTWVTVGAFVVFLGLAIAIKFEFEPDRPQPVAPVVQSEPVDGGDAGGSSGAGTGETTGGGTEPADGES